MDDWLKMKAAELGRGIGRGEIDPAELTETYLSAIDAHPERDRVYQAVTPDRARAEAEAASARAKAKCRRGVLDGVPISWKDLFHAVGERTRAGSALLDEAPAAAADALALARGTAEGLVCLGKTHMTEIAFSGLGVNPVTATSPNVNGADWAPGGSSSGAAASVALGLAAAGIGSDTGGSVRIPSAWQNLVGLKTTLGVVPVEGSVALAAGFDTVGPLCRSVEDAALLTAAMTGGRAPDLSAASLKGKRILVDEATMFDGADPEPVAAFEAGIARLQEAGAVVERRTVPEFAEVLKISAPLVVGEAWAEWGDRIETSGELMFDQIRRRTEGGRTVTAADYLRARVTMSSLRVAYARRVGGYDAVAAPTAPILPPSVKRLLEDADYYADRNLMALRNTRIGNLLGLCALTLPLPEPGCGLMLFGRAFGEGALCRLGAAAEAALAG